MWQELLDSELLLAKLKVSRKNPRMNQPAHIHL